MLDWLAGMEIRIFEEPYSREKLERELTRKTNLVAIVAVHDGNPVAFKVGFELTMTLFYSWIGGVVPEARGHGIARRLMDQQHVIARDEGYECIRTETENRFKPMLILNLKCGFDVVGVRTSEDYPKTVIMLEKRLLP